LSGWERTQQVTRHTVTALHETEATIELVGAVLHLIPGIGAPTAMKYGGQELGAAATDLAHVSNALAQGAEAASGSAGLEAGFQRRDDEWKHSAKLAQRESDQLDKQITAADIRVKIAERSLEVHAKSIEQTEEIFAFYQDRFTGLGLYTFLAKTLQELYRDAFNSAYAMAKLAEQAYRFERPEDTSTTIQGWDPAHGGLLTGERLLLDLQNLERKFMESDYRRLEVEQSFSLAQLDPAMLQQLREQGQCDIDIKELFFDLGYPGHYRRRIKAVRLTVPCVAGPFANVGATLKLISSAMRLDPTSESVAVPARHAVSIATSGGQNDAGVFEFSFRDERYMPFEGAGAVSKWQLSLPKSFRAFDYQTISDVVLRISYSALEDETLRTKVENQAALAPLPALLTQLKNHDLQSVISLRHDLPDTFAALTSSQVNTSIPLTIDLRRKASFLGSRAITVKAARWVLRTKPRAMAPTATFKLTRGVTQTAVSAFTGKTSGMVGTNAAGAPEFTLFESPDIVAGVGAWFGDSYTLSLTSAGNVAAAAGTVGIDQREVVDILLHVDYHLT